MSPPRRRIRDLARNAPRYADQLRRMAAAAVADRIQPAVDRFRDPWPSDRDLPAAPPADRPVFVFDPAAVKQRAALFAERYPAEAERIVRRAEQLAAGRFALLGSPPTDFSGGIDWDLDFAHGVRFDRRHYRRQVVRRYDGSDVKVPWELARMQHLPVLALAYRLTGAEHFARAAVDHVEQFARANPPRLGIHWVCAMEVGLRIASVALAQTMLADWLSREPDRRRTLFRLALASGRFIEKNLEYSVVLTSNHYLSDLLGLLAVGAAYPELAEAARWRRFATSELEAEFAKQFHEDGANFESSTPYHRYSLELCALMYLIDRGADRALGEAFRTRLAAAFRFVSTACYPDGTVPLIGDNDSGRAFKLLDRPDRSMHYLCELGTALFGESLLVRPVDRVDPEVFWLLGEEADAAASHAPRAHASVHHADCGRAFLEGERVKAAIVCGPVGQNENGGHAHNDALSLTLFADGCEVLTDPGTFCYTQDPAQRDAFRSTAAHSTIQVDGAEINPFLAGQPFCMPEAAEAHGTLTEKENGWLAFAGSHAGYARLADPVAVSRTVWFHESIPLVVLDDSADCRGSHAYVSRLVLDPAVAVQRLEGGNRPALPGSIASPLPADAWRCEFELATPGGRVLVFADVREDDEWRVAPGWVSPAYGVRRETKVIARRWTETGPTERIAALYVPPDGRA